MDALKRAIPSMFHRRLLLLLAVMCLSVSAVAAQLMRLAVVEGEQRLEEAEKVLSTVSLLPTVRGSILDRKGRVLAADVPADDVAISYEVISGEWAYDQAAKAARQAMGDRWRQMSRAAREAAIIDHSTPFEAELETMWQTLAAASGVPRDELESRKQEVLRRVQMIRADVWSRRALREARLREEPVTFEEVAIDIADQRQAHTLLNDVDEQTITYLRRHADRLPGLKIVSGKRRLYPLTEATIEVPRDSFPSPIRSEQPIEIQVRHLGDHLVGDMRNIWAEDVDEDEGGRPYRRSTGAVDMKGYLPGDRKGKRGIELAEEWRLRGIRGRTTHNLETDVTTVDQPTRGDDVKLTLDMHLQARIQALLNPKVGLMRVQEYHRNEDLPVGTPLNGAVVVMEVDTGDLLALVTSPAGPPEDEKAAWPSKDDLWTYNRAIAAVYPPGSTLKPIVYTLAAAESAIQTDQVIECNGHYHEDNPNAVRCWIYRPQYWYRTHGPLGPVEAIARSCNIYFYSCGDRLNPVRLVAGLHEFGFDRKANLGLPEEVSGILPRLDGNNPPAQALTRSNAIFMGIGQGPIAATPLQVAAAHAALARGGYYLSPVLIGSRRAQQVGHEITLRPRVVDIALEGMYESANNPDFGTGHHLGGVNPTRDSPKGEPIINLPGVLTRAKTGTAQAPTRFEDVNENGRLDEGEPIIRQGDHSWYVCHVARPGETRAAYIVVTIVEYGGSGGRVSGPVTNQVLHALRAEGYL